MVGRGWPEIKNIYIYIYPYIYIYTYIHTYIYIYIYREREREREKEREGWDGGLDLEEVGILLERVEGLEKLRPLLFPLRIV